MTVMNSIVADVLHKVADLLDLKGENPFRVRAYRNAARTVSGLSNNLSDMIDSGSDLTALAGIGRELANKIREIIHTGSLLQLKQLEEEFPPNLRNLMKIAGLGPRRIQILHRELHIDSLESLEKAARKGKIRTIEGFSEKIENTILRELKALGGSMAKRRIKLTEAEQIAEPLVQYLKKIEGVEEVVVAGSYRRRRDTIGDLDLLAIAKNKAAVMNHFTRHKDVQKVVSNGRTRSSIILRSGLQVDLRVFPGSSYGAALQYFTGSKAHNIAVRRLGARNKLKINEYGVFKGKKRLSGTSEENIYKAAGLPYIEPELREDWGEVEAAQNGSLPRLVTVADIRGDLHTHTDETDGRAGLEAMAVAAARKGYCYLAITDHSKRVAMVHGLDADRLRRQMEKIDRLNEKLDEIVLLKGIEVDILKDGSLDLPDDILKELDLTVCSVHYNMNLPPEQMTTRIMKAMDNPYFNILAHPTGRLLNERRAYEIDMERILEAAKNKGCFMEVNSNPDRLDLSGHHCKMAKEIGVLLAVSTDSHSTENLDFIRYGVDQARRGWLEPKDIINTRSLKELRKILKRN